MVERFRKKPVEVEAIRFTGHNDSEIAGFVGDAGYDPEDRYPSWKIRTLEGTMELRVGDWLVKGTRGEFYPVKPGPFQDTFERIEG